MSEKCYFHLIMWAAVVLSIGGVILAAFVLKEPSHGGRGGALAVAIALFSLFATRNYAADVYDALTRRSHEIKTRILKLTSEGQDKNSPSSPEQKLNALEARLRLDAEGLRDQNMCLAIATGLGTIFWGFGDIFAVWFM